MKTTPPGQSQKANCIALILGICSLRYMLLFETEFHISLSTFFHGKQAGFCPGREGVFIFHLCLKGLKLTSCNSWKNAFFTILAVQC